MLTRPTALAVALALCSGCSWMWPTVVRTEPDEPLLHSGFPLVGGLRLDGALCSLVSAGPDATRAVNPPEPPPPPVPLAEACQAIAHEPPGGRPSPISVALDTPHGRAAGYLFGRGPVSGVAVVFSGLGMPPDGWINSRFAELASRDGLLAFAPARDESAHPIYFDPVREARRALAAAQQIASACGAERGLVGFLGISMGGMEALLANREALQGGLRTRAVALDPVLDTAQVTAHLDSFWHGLGTDAIQAYFRRILTGRYREDPPPSFQALMARTAAHPGAMSELGRDTPSAWLCGAPRESYDVLLSDTDPVLGDGQRDFARRCGFPLRRAGAPGHTPLACRLALFEEMVRALRGPSPAAPVALTASWARSRGTSPASTD